MKSHAKGSNRVKWSQYITLKINNKHQTKVSAHFVFFPVCEDSVLVYSTGFDFFSRKNKSIKKIPSQKYPHLNVRFWGTYGVIDCKISSLKLQRWSSEFVRVPMVSDWAKFAVQISKDEAPTPLLTGGLSFVYFHASIACPSCNFENSQRLSNSTELRTKDIAGSSKQ